MPERRNEVPYGISKIEQPLMEQPYFAKWEPPCMGAKPKPRALHVDIYSPRKTGVQYRRLSIWCPCLAWANRFARGWKLQWKNVARTPDGKMETGLHGQSAEGRQEDSRSWIEIKSWGTLQHHQRKPIPKFSSVWEISGGPFRRLFSTFDYSTSYHIPGSRWHKSGQNSQNVEPSWMNLKILLGHWHVENMSHLIITRNKTARFFFVCIERLGRWTIPPLPYFRFY